MLKLNDPDHNSVSCESKQEHFAQEHAVPDVMNICGWLNMLIVSVIPINQILLRMKHQLAPLLNLQGSFKSGPKWLRAQEFFLALFTLSS